MNSIKSIGMIGIAMFLLFACNPAAVTLPDATATPTTAPQTTQEPASFPLSERGPYFTGRRAYTFIDESRNGRKVQITLWYDAKSGIRLYNNDR